MNFQTTTEEQYTKYRLNNYGPASLTLVKGEGDYVWDDQGNRYLDFTSGLATTNLGHCHPALVKAIQAQAAQLMHVSNLYKIPLQGQLSEAIVKLAGPGKAFFCNSGTEASEALIKLSRLYGNQKSGTSGTVTKVIVSRNGFHGRTFGGMSATPQEKIQKGFHPMLSGFPVATLNDIDSFEKLVDDETAAILIEPIQGEGGIHVASNVFLRDLRTLCNDKKILLLLDEVQSGIGRTGAFFAHEAAGIHPDAIGMAKGLGGGFPIGAMWISENYADLFTPGSHGSTFGGNPLACSAALAVIETIVSENLLQRVQKLSAPWISRLESFAEKFDLLKEVRGRGFLVGLEFVNDPSPVQKSLQKRGLLTVRAGGNVLRILPSMTVTEKNLQDSLEIIEKTMQEHSNLVGRTA